MDLHERLSATSSPSAAPLVLDGRDPFAEIKNRIHLSLVSELGPTLVNVADSAEARERAMAQIR